MAAGDLSQGFELNRKLRYGDAAAVFDETSESCPGDPLPLVMSGTAYLNGGVPEEAVARFSKALDLQPTDPVLYLYRGEALLKMGLEAEARRDFEAARALAAGDERVVTAASARLRSPADSLPKDMTR